MTNFKANFKGASLRCADSRGGCLYMGTGAAGEQEVPRAPSAHSE
jgi:hypothetical protein